MNELFELKQSYVRIINGLGFEILDKYHAEAESFREKMNAMIEPLGCFRKDACLNCGYAVEGFKLITGSVPDGWRMSKKFPGIAIPDKKKAKGRWWAGKLAELKKPSTEDLAKDLGFYPFFDDLGSTEKRPLSNRPAYCTNVGYLFQGGVYYVAYPAVLKFPDKIPHEAIPDEEGRKLFKT